MSFPGNQLEHGQSLIEVIITIGVFSILMGVGLTLFFGGRTSVNDSLQEIRALGLARTGLEASRVIRDQSWAALVEGPHGVVLGTSSWQFSGTQDVVDEFTRQVSISAVGPDIKKVRARISWTTNRPQELELVVHLTNWRGAQESGGDTGGDSPSGDWQQPQTLGSIDLGPGNQATDLDVKNKIVYLSATAAAASKPDFFIVDATNGQNPWILSSLNTGDSLHGIDVAGTYAFVVGSDDNEEFMVIDVSNTAAPQKVASMDLSGSADGLTIFYYNNHVFVGRAAGASGTFTVIDVTNPLQPQEVATLSVGNQINDIAVFNQRAYLGTLDISSGLIIVDVINPAAPQVLGSLNVGMSVFSIHLEREDVVTVGGTTTLFLVDASDPAAISMLGSVNLGVTTHDIFVSYPFAFLGTDAANQEFQVWNIQDPTNPTLWSSYNFSQVATGVDYENNIVYIAVRSNDALRLITSP